MPPRRSSRIIKRSGSVVPSNAVQTCIARASTPTSKKDPVFKTEIDSPSQTSDSHVPGPHSSADDKKAILHSQDDIVGLVQQEVQIGHFSTKRDDILAAAGSNQEEIEKAAQPLSAPFSKDEDASLLPIIRRYPITNILYLRQIARNQFHLFNITKLRKLQPKKEDLDLEDTPDLVELLRCLNIFWQIKLVLEDPSIMRELNSAFTEYLDRLLLLYEIYTWESV